MPTEEERRRRQRAQQNVTTQSAPPRPTRRDVRAAQAPQIAALQDDFGAFRAAQPDAPMPSDMRQRAAMLSAERSQGVTPDMRRGIEQGFQAGEAQIGLTRAEAGARSMEGLRALGEGVGAATAPVFDFFGRSREARAHERAAQTGADAQRDVAATQAGAQRDVAQTEAASRRDVAGLDAEVRREDIDMRRELGQMELGLSERELDIAERQLTPNRRERIAEIQDLLGAGLLDEDQARQMILRLFEDDANMTEMSAPPMQREGGGVGESVGRWNTFGLARRIGEGAPQFSRDLFRGATGF